MHTKTGEKEFLKSYIGLSSCHLTSTGQTAHWAGINGAVYASPMGRLGWHKWCSLARPSKGQCAISKILSSLIFSLFIEQNIFFPETCFAYNISKPKFTVCTLHIETRVLYSFGIIVYCFLWK